MLENEFPQNQNDTPEPPQTRVGDLAAMLRVMGPLNIKLPDPMTGRRQLLADLCRFIGVKVGTVPPESLGFAPEQPALNNGTGVTSQNAQPVVQSPALVFTMYELPPRQEQTLRHLLNGDSEKQVARKLELSQHTVHAYVKALYRRFGVSSRAELLAKHLKK